MSKINKFTGLTGKSGATLYQHIDCTLGLVANDETIASLDINAYEILKRDEVKAILRMMENEKYGSYIKTLLNGSEESDAFGVVTPIIKFLNSKRAFGFTDLKGVQRIVAIPSFSVSEDGDRLGTFNKQLFNVALAYVEFLSIRTSENAESEFKKVERKIVYLQEMIAKRFLSKRFKEKFNFKFSGVSGVALTGNLSYDGIAIPKWYADEFGLEIGDLGLVTRDPIQNIFICLRIEGFTENEIRVNSHTFTWLGGDFDGDRTQFIPMSNIIRECVKRHVATEAIDTIVSEITALLPTSLYENEKFSRLIRDYSL